MREKKEKKKGTEYMEFVFEEPTVKKVKVNIEPCPCCGSEILTCNKIYTGNGADTFGGYAYIKCENCNHKVKKESYNIGWGDTLEGLFNQALEEWNSQAKHYGKSSGEKDAKILEWVKTMRDYDLSDMFQDALNELEKIVKEK